MSLVLLACALLVLPTSKVGGRLAHLRRGPSAPVALVAQAPDPLALAGIFDLLAACLRAGLPTAAAVRAVAPCAPTVLAVRLRTAADLLALGADPAVAWQPVADDPATESLARMARRSARSGSSLADGLAELAAQRRADAEDAAAARAERAGVLIAGPLGLCFLPAFVCLGIVPVVIGLAGQLMGGEML